MHYDGPGGGRVRDFNPADEGKQSGGVVWNSMVGPAGEVELLDLAHLIETTLRGRKEPEVTLDGMRFTSALHNRPM